MTSHRIGKLAIVLFGAMGVGGVHALPALQNATSIGAGPNHACAALDGGGASCWGSNYSPILARTTSGYAAGAVQGLDASLVRVAVGSSHACAAGADGRLWCWGYNYSGQLGLGSGVSESRSPALVTAVSGVTDASASERHTCAVAQQAAYCWGANAFGEIGDGTTVQRNLPVPVSGLASGVTRVAAGGYYNEAFSCAVAGGGAWCWGANGSGQLGDGTGAQRLAPVPVSGLAANAADVAAGGRHACAVQGGAVVCWGDNASGQLGDGTFATRLAPVAVVNAGSGMLRVAAGERHSCAVRDDGALLCWGSNSTGQLGDGTTDTRTIAAPVAGLGGPVVDVALGSEFSCALLVSGAVQCFGSNGSQSLGTGTLSPRLKAVEVKDVPAGFAKLTAGGAHSCATTGAGAALCWGEGAYGQLGNGKRTVGVYPQGVTSLVAGTAGISAGREHTCARTGAGGAFCWGAGWMGRLGNGSQSDALVPSAVQGLDSGVDDIAAGGMFSCAIAAGAAECWGDNLRGSLGNGGLPQSSDVPVDVVGLQQGVTRIVAGDGHACALRSGGGIKCWGANGDGQIGDGTWIDRPTPIDVLGLNSGVTSFTAGRVHSCAVTQSGSVLCWGGNTSGQVGDGTTQGRPAPALVAGLPGSAVQVTAGTAHSCALLEGGEVRCWGDNGQGQLGENVAAGERALVPVVVRLGEPAFAVTAGGSHTCALLGSGRAKCWGESSRSQLGNGDAGASPIPQFVVVGDFATHLELTTAPSPSTNAQYVTLAARVGAIDVVPAGDVAFTDGGAPLACAQPFGQSHVPLALGMAKCVVPLLAGVHQLRADYISDGSLLASSGSALHTVVAIAGQHCAGFDDVDAASPFCASVEWMKNRAVSLGCAPFAFCPSVDVSRLGMAAFMDRLGAALGPTVVWTTGQFLQLYQSGLACPGHVPEAAYPRTVIVDAVVSGVGSTAGVLDLVAARRRATTYAVEPAGAVVRVSTDGVQPLTVRLAGTVQVEADEGLEIGFTWSGDPTSITLGDARCVVRGLVFSRDATHSPFDVSTGAAP